MITKLLRTGPGRHRKVRSPVPVPLVASAALVASMITVYLAVPVHRSPAAELHAYNPSPAMLSLEPVPLHHPFPAPARTSTTAPAYTPRHATPPAPAPTRTRTYTQTPGSLSGTLGCGGLEQLWDRAGGSPAEAETAASIAMAESGGNQYAHSPTDDIGYWQINASHGPALATYDPDGNARAAVLISGDGTNWTPWTTYTSGAYAGRC